MSLFDNLSSISIKKIGKLIASKGAPLPASALTGGAAGPILSMISEAFGIGGDDPKALEKAIASDPSAAIKLREIQSNQFDDGVADRSVVTGGRKARNRDDYPFHLAPGMDIPGDRNLTRICDPSELTGLFKK